MDITTAYAEIVKAERNADGDLVVVGKATGPDLDLDQQICDPDWLKSAMPAWMSSGGNIREQHSSIAAGVATELEQRGDAWMVTATVVDPVSARKVEKGVLKGFSIGIRSPRVVKDVAAPGGRIVGGTVVETSLVDRPANPTCTLVLAKMAKPGPVVAAEVSKGLVHVEELHDEAGELLPRLEKALIGYDLVAVQKGNSKAQIKDARKAIALLAGVVQAEAACLADGSGTASCDIDLVMGAIHAIEYFVNREQEAAMAHVELSDTPDTTKAAAPSADAAPAEPAAPEAPAEKAATPETPPPAAEKAAEGENNPDLTELVKAAVAEAIAPLQERLAKAEAAPRDGGPVLARTAQEKAIAGAREGHLTKAADFEAKAAQHQGQAREGYLTLAAQERDKAATITS
jgi:hypothetical protein